MVFVELKGRQIEDALRQMETSYEMMCKHKSMHPNKHDQWREAKGKYIALPSHKKGCAGLMLGKHGFPLAQHHRATLRKKFGSRTLCLSGNYSGGNLQSLAKMVWE